MSREQKIKELKQLLGGGAERHLEIILDGKMVSSVQLPVNEWIEENIEGNPRVEITDNECTVEIKKLINGII